MQSIQEVGKELALKEVLENCKEFAKIGKGFLHSVLKSFETIKQPTHEVCIHHMMGQQCPTEFSSLTVSKNKMFDLFCKTNTNATTSNILLSAAEVRVRYPDVYSSVKYETQKSLSERFDEICMEHGLFCTYDLEKGEFIWTEHELSENLKHVFCPSLVVPSSFTVYYSHRLSKLQLKQIILYHFMHPDERGLLSSLSEKEVAVLLGCHVKSVKANNLFFEEIGLIYYSKSDNSKVNIWLKDYNTYHLSKEEGGEGYIHMSRELLSNLLSLDDVNVLRFEIKKTVKYDSDTIKYIHQTGEAKRTAPSILTCDELKRVVPLHLRTPSQLIRIANRSSTAFDTKIEGSTVIFKLKEQYNGKIIKKEQQVKRFEEMKNYLMGIYPEGTFIEVKQINDLVHLSFEYGLKRVKEAVNDTHETYEIFHRPSFNLGGMVRTIIKNSYLKNLA